jgi:hypothetical protein
MSTPQCPPPTHKVMACPDVDFTRTTCNDLIEIFEALGIEAARAGMLNEIRSVLFFDGGYINYRHMSILVDVMTFRGALTAVSRHGINRGEQVRGVKCPRMFFLEIKRRVGASCHTHTQPFTLALLPRSTVCQADRLSVPHPIPPPSHHHQQKHTT